MSALADRIKIARNGSVGSHDIDLSVQHILNCGAEIAGRYVSVTFLSLDGVSSRVM